MKKNREEIFAELRIACEKRKALREFYDNQWQVLLSQFDGKVYNKKFRDATNNELQKVNSLMWASFDEAHSTIAQHRHIIHVVDVTLYYRESAWNYTLNDAEKLYIRIVCVLDKNQNLRISKAVTLSDEQNTAWVQSFDKETERTKTIFNKFDDYMNIVEQLDTYLQAYNDLPPRFKDYIGTQYAHIW